MHQGGSASALILHMKHERHKVSMLSRLIVVLPPLCLLSLLTRLNSHQSRWSTLFLEQVCTHTNGTLSRKHCHFYDGLLLLQGGSLRAAQAPLSQGNGLHHGQLGVPPTWDSCGQTLRPAVRIPGSGKHFGRDLGATILSSGFNPQPNGQTKTPPGAGRLHCL